MLDELTEKLKENKKAAIGQTITWFVVTIIIVLMVFLFMIISVGFAYLKADDESTKGFIGAYADLVEFENLLNTKVNVFENDERTIREWLGFLSDDKTSKDAKAIVKNKIKKYFDEAVEEKQDEQYLIFVQFESEGDDDIFLHYSYDFFVVLREQGNQEVIVENLNKKENIPSDEYFFVFDSAMAEPITAIGKEGFTKERVDLTEFGIKTVINGKRYILTYFTIKRAK